MGATVVGWLGDTHVDGWLELVSNRHKKERGACGAPLSRYNFIAYSRAIWTGCPSRSRDTNRLLALNFLLRSRDNACLIVIIGAILSDVKRISVNLRLCHSDIGH